MIILGIESAIAGGSIALGRDGEVVASDRSNAAVSRAEDLLPRISALMDTSGLEKSALKMIAVSRGPGSFTGLRIGIATALGLARALEISCIGVPIFEAIAAHFEITAGNAIVLPMGKNDVAFRFVDRPDITDSASTAEEFEHILADNPEARILAVEKCEDRLSEILSDRIVNIEMSLAEIVVLQAPSWKSEPDLSPIYLQHNLRGNQLF